MARALTAALVVVLLVVSGAGGAETQAPKRGGTVVVGVPTGFEPACFNASLAVCYRPSPFGIFGIGEDLIIARPFSSRPDLTFRPDLVSRVTLTKKPFTVTFHIRPEARWSDGRPVTARDFQFHHRSAVASEFLRACCPDDWFLSVTRTHIVDAKTFRMRVRSPVALPLVKASFRPGVAPRHALAGVDLSSPVDLIANPRTGKPLGSGPFLMQGRQRGRQITLVRNPRYWGPHAAYLDRLVFRFLPPNELADALRRGTIDLIYPGAPIADAAIQELRRSRPPGMTVASSRGTLWENLAIRVGPGGHSALRSKLLRRALALGLDRARLVRMLEQRVFGRATQRLAPLESVVFLSQSPYHEPNWKAYRRQPAEARRLLARAGCMAGGDGIRLCGGERLSLRVGTSAGVERRRLTLDVIQGQLRQLGVEVLPQYFPQTRAVEDAFKNGDLDLALWAWDYGVSGGFTPGGLFRCGGGNNVTGHCSRLVTRELVNADRVLDEDARARALNRADRLLAQDVPVIPLYQVPAYVAHRTKVRIPDLDPNDALWNVVDWWLDR